MNQKFHKKVRKLVNETFKDLPDVEYYVTSVTKPNRLGKPVTRQTVRLSPNSKRGKLKFYLKQARRLHASPKKLDTK